jgi:hypothetical protein
MSGGNYLAEAHISPERTLQKSGKIDGFGFNYVKNHAQPL